MHIRPFHPSDLPIIADVSAQAFADDPLLLSLHPYLKEYPADWRAHVLRRTCMSALMPCTIGFVAVADAEDCVPSAASQKVVDRAPVLDAATTTTVPKVDEIMGFIFVTRKPAEAAAAKGTSSLAQEAWAAHPLANPFSPLSAWYHGVALSVSETLIPMFQLDRSARAQPSGRSFLERLRAHRAPVATANPNADFANLRDTAWWHIRVLCVSPRFQRRGVGGALVRACLRIAASEGVPAGLRGSELGQKLYLKEGFVGVGWCGAGFHGQGADSKEEGVLSRVMVWDRTGRWVNDQGWIEN